MDAQSSSVAVPPHPHVPRTRCGETLSDKGPLIAATDPRIVMAEQITHDVVKEALSTGGPSPVDATATTTIDSAGTGAVPSGPSTINPKPSDDLPTQKRSDAASADAAHHLVNGDSSEHSASEDVNSQAIADASGGSDTDISRPGSVDQAKERGEGHLRSNSMKKPTSFKSVSVTKNFLAKSAVTTPVVRPGEKAPAAGQTNAMLLQTAKPRLVAKSGSALGNVPRSSLSKTNGAASGPDASKVWNKNQPVPVPPPKQFTDEELKQQYGIHLATRLQADEGSKEAKWADIDDDEDDWAPDTVQWMDGTKSTVAAVENQPPSPEEPKPVEKLEVVVEAPKPVPTPVVLTQRPSSTSGTKTILKPGAHAQTSSGKTGLVLKGQPEKPTLVAKPSTAAVKSPWAPLPPVDKVSPLHITPPLQQQAPPSRFAQRDAHGYDAMPPPPAKPEIAPDDFNRSWRDERGNRELFNSHNGRYEPVNETRRGSVRENSYRQQPSVLQRPSHDGPAEPSAAFQTSRNSGDVPSWGRRRNSSNVSGGSGRRMSIDRRAPDLPHIPLNIQRRGSQSVNGTESLTPGTPRPTSTVQKHSPNVPNAQPTSPFGSVGSSAVQDIAAVIPTAPVQLENAVEIQNRLMREKLERARLAKQKEREAEEKEESERKERLRKKLESLGLSDTAKKAKEPSPSRPAEKSPQKEKAVPVSVQSPPKPPVPTSEGEVAQYGMMKVHLPHPVKKPYHPDTAATKSFRGTESVPKASTSPVKAQTEAAQKSAPSLAQPHQPQPSSTFTRDNEKNKAQVEQPQAYQTDGASSQGPRPAQAPKTAWSPSLPQPPPQQPRPWASSVWGPPPAAKDRALGNGTFDSGYTRGQPRSGGQLPPQQHQQHQQQQQQPVQAPTVGANQTIKPSTIQAQVAPVQPFAQQTMFSQQNSVAPNPGPIAPPPAKTWGNFAAVISHDDQSLIDKARQEHERLSGQTFLPEIIETYTDHHGKSLKTIHSKVSPPTVSPEVKSREDVAKPVIEGLLQSTVPGARPSRFFPRPSETTSQSSSTPNMADSPPPPPETESHPAFTGDSSNPVVKMPKPSPRVRLPPAAIAEAVAAAEAPVSMPSRARLGLGARPLALDPEWQARFNSLLDKSPQPAPAHNDKTPVVAGSAVPTKIAASSKAPLDVRENIASATVSLPNAVNRKTFVEDSTSGVTSRQSAEGVLLEDREFGSLPTVKVAKVPHLAANEPPAGFPPNQPNRKYQRPLEITSKPALNILDIDYNADTIDLIVRLEHMRHAVTKSIAKKRGGRKPLGYNKPKRNSMPNGGPPGSGSGSGPNQRARKPSNYPNQGSNTNTNSTPPRSSASNAWTTNNRSTTQHNNTNNTHWTRRTTSAAPVH
ncbi:hypothetical protein K504DRAFT_433312 [Pleomassaria siparia CBS 279.74]|uniref:PI-PLC Y-box domain-containing protein n=1 Tax=Pleomassaria siparia CBS 279.74 TaxID=1314801 RepID=A0A6G1K8M5_9PLEO|nr:hypothetical protein K504DRAFT_433312 [Pleomassaria siparia CBS 279.74]